MQMNIQVVTKNGDVREMPRSLAKMSELIRTMLPDDDEEEYDQEIPLPNVTTSIFDKVLVFLKEYSERPMKEIEKPIRSADMADLVEPFYVEFVCIPQHELFDLIMAANYLDIRPLLDLTCATVASMIKGKSPEEIRRTFNITNDYTPEEEATMRDEAKLCEESM